jgi:hypothetical protein
MILMVPMPSERNARITPSTIASEFFRTADHAPACCETDNFGPDGERTGKRRFMTALCDQAGPKVDDLVAAVMAQSRSLRGDVPPTDDVSLLVLEYTGEHTPL